MRTKKVFYSIAIAAALASCTAEEVEVVNTPQQNLSVRPVLGDVELVTATPSSRLAIGEGGIYQPQWQEGDKMGAAIIDKALYTSEADYKAKWDANVTAKQDPYTGMYDIIQSYGSNANFDYSNGAYYLNADMPLVEGNYLFYAPYNKNMQYRSAMTVQVPAVQYGTTEMGALDHFYKSGAVVRVGYDFLAYNGGKAQRPNLTLFDVFSYPMFTIKNNFKGYLHKKNEDGKFEYVKYEGGTVEIDKIQLYAMDADGRNEVQAVLGGQLGHAKVKDCTELGTLSTNWEDKLFENKTIDLLETQTQTTSTNNHMITEVVIDRKVATEDEIEVYAVMPADKYNSLLAKVYLTIDGKQYRIERQYINVDDEGKVKQGNTTKREILMTSEVGEINLVPGQRYPQEELNWNADSESPLSAKKSAGSILTIDLTGGLETGGVQVAVDVTKENTTPNLTAFIDNNKEWIEIFSEMQNGTALVEGTTEGFVFATNTEAKIDAEIIKALNTYNNKGSLTLSKALIIDNDVKVVAVDGQNVTFAAGDVQYTITLADNTAYTVNENIVKSTAGSLHVFFNNYIHNDETIYKNVSVDSPLAILNVISELDAEALMNNGHINAAYTIDGEITNNGNIFINEDNVELKIIAGEGNIYGTEKLFTSEVTIIGGTQTGRYMSTETQDGFKFVAEVAKLKWVSIYDTQYAPNTVLTNAIINQLSNITTYAITGLNFSEPSVDLAGKTIYVQPGSGEIIITGNGTYHTKLTNLNIVNKTTRDVKLSNVNATGTYDKGTNPDIVYGELYTSDTATWNGKKVNK